MFNLFKGGKPVTKKEGYLSIDGRIYNTLGEAQSASFREEMYRLFKTYNISSWNMYDKRFKVVEILERYT